MTKKQIKHYASERLCETERNVLQHIDNPFILDLKYAFADEENLYLILQLCNGGDLQFHLSEERHHRFAAAQTEL